ncbi:MAG: DUF3048 domain-containing protein, partial [Anaerolineales bacterium]|nr:DUF3048 domain-containing protein [Anaerolineales bacterium]
CQTASPPTATPSPSVQPTALANVPTNTPDATETAVPTMPPPPTAIPTTAAATPNLQDAATLTPATPTATIIGMIGPEPFPENINPLTGLPVSDPAILARRPIVVKVSNAPPIVRPQAGLNRADLVFEHYAEGGLTRFTAVFYTHDVSIVGSIRSARLIDFEIPHMYDAAFAYSGSSGPLRVRFQESDFFDRIISPDFGHGGFYRMEEEGKSFVHSLYTDTYTLRETLSERGQEVPPTLANHMAFREEPLYPGEPATRIELWYTGTNATWFYSNGRYLRWSDGEAHLEAYTGQQLTFKNVVVIAANHVNTDIIEDTNNSPSIEIQLWGSGPVSIFRDGQRFDGTWQRNDPNHMLTFYDQDGNMLPLAPGNTFFQIVPLGFDRLTITP